MSSPFATGFVVAALSTVVALPLAGQEREPIPLSQYQSVTQSVGWVDVTVEYRLEQRDQATAG